MTELSRRIGAELAVLRYHWDEVYSIWHDAASQEFRALWKIGPPAGDVLSSATAEGLRKAIWTDYRARRLAAGRALRFRPRRWWHW